MAVLVSISRSKSLASLRLRPSQAKVGGDVRQRGGISGVASGGHRSGRLRCDREGLVLDRRRDQLGHAFDLHVAVLELPLVVGLQQHRAHQPGDDRSQDVADEAGFWIAPHLRDSCPAMAAGPGRPFRSPRHRPRSGAPGRG